MIINKITIPIINDDNSIIAVKPVTNNDLKMTVQPAKIVYKGEEIEPYEGSYEVTPSLSEQILQTAQKKMSQNVIIHEIPISKTLNERGGYTVIIGG